MTAPTIEEIDRLALKFDQGYAEINDITTRMDDWLKTLSTKELQEFKSLVQRPESIAKLPDGDKKRFATFVHKMCVERA